MMHAKLPVNEIWCTTIRQALTVSLKEKKKQNKEKQERSFQFRVEIMALIFYFSVSGTSSAGPYCTFWTQVFWF